MGSMNVSMSTLLLLGIAVGAAGCGVPQSQHDAAMADANKAKTTCEEKLAAAQQDIDDLKTKLADAEGRAGAADEARQEKP